MRRFPFYAYPNFPYSFSPAEASFHRPRRPSSTPAFSPASPSPTPRSVINVPVSDSVPSQLSSSPAQPPLAAVPLIDPSTAATTIQSYFRGFCVRRHHPLLHLRSIAIARKQLEELQSEFERPEFSLKVKASEKERLRFNEGVMAIILSLDAIEGSMAEVRSQRKEATKMAIKLQDAIDAMVMQKDEIAALDPIADEGGIAQNEGGMAPSEGSSLPDQPLEEKLLSSEDEDADKLTPNHANNDVMVEVEDVSPLLPHEMDLDQRAETRLGCVEPQIQRAKSMSNAEEDMSYITGESAGSDASHAVEREGENGINALHVETQENHMKNDGKLDQGTSVDDTIGPGNGSAERESFDGSYAGMDVLQEGKIGIGQDVGLCADTLTAETPSAPQNDPILRELSEDCGQLKSLVGKLLVQNKAQSNILYALAERLEALEHQQQLNCRHDQQKMREKRKLKKGSKRSGKFPNWECY